MAVLINFKICDNSKDCSGIEACLTEAFYWDEKRKTIAVENTKCVSCDRCEEACPVGAIRVAKTKEEYKKIKKEIEKDLRKVSDLFIDRYGTESISSSFSIPQNKFDIQILESTKLAVVELFNHDSIKCLLYSIPIKELFKNFDIKYRKIEIKDSSPLKKYKIKELPSLLFFKEGRLIGKTEGYYEIGRIKELKAKINKIVHQNK